MVKNLEIFPALKIKNLWKIPHLVLKKLIKNDLPS